MSAPERAEAGDALDAYLLTVPTDLSAARWRAWRGKNPPPYMENRRGGRCGVCGGALAPVSKICPACWKRESDALIELSGR